MICRAGWIAAALLTVFAPAWAAAQTQPEPATVKFGVLAYLGEDEARDHWQATADYLTEAIPGCKFELVPLGYSSLLDAVRQGGVDFVAMEPSNYIALEAENAATAIATIKTSRNGKIYRNYGAVIFCRADRNDINSLGDLRGKTFLAYDELAFGGWRMAWREFKQQGIDPYKDFRSLSFLSGGAEPNQPIHSQFEIADAIRNGKCDAGCVRTGVLEHMEKAGKTRLADFKILAEKPESHTTFPFILSTKLYAEWPFARVKGVSEDLALQVALALLQMPADSPAAKAARCDGWTVPADYAEVRRCLQELNLPPYRDQGKFTLMQVLRQYWYWLAVAAAFVSMWVALAALRVNRKLHRLREGLEGELSRRQEAQEALRLDESRLQTLVQMTEMGKLTLHELTHFTMEEAVRLTKSTIGYIAYMSDDESVLTMYAWSKVAMDECAIMDKPIVYPVATTGLWGEAVRQRRPIITNEYAMPNPLKKGYPSGHVAVARHMNIPVFDGNKIVAVAGVGNKVEPYDESDVRQLRLLMDGMWKLAQRRRAEESLRKLNRELKMLSDCNQILLRRDTEKELLQDICQTIVSVGGYRMAWVGMAMDDAGKSVQPIAWAGNEDGYLKHLIISWADDARGQGPCGRSIRTAQPCVCEDIQADPNYAEWRSAAAERAFVSSISVPLMFGQQATGCLVIYSDKVGEFNVDEQRLLAELAGDMSFGLMAIRTRQQREKAEQSVRRINRELRMISDCNQVLVRSVSEEQLLKDVCQTIVDVGGYRLAWVGYAEDDAGKTVRPMAFAGQEDGYLSTIHISWADVPHGRGPTGLAIRTGKPAVCHDFTDKSVFVPWPAEALKRGYASMLVLPLLAGGKAFGALTLYADKPNEFRDEEVRLLAELAGDLSYGIGALRMRAHREQAEEELRLTHQYLLDIIEFLPDATFVIDKDKRIIAWNRALEEMTGVPKEQMLRQGDHAYSLPFYATRRPILIDLIGVDDAEIAARYDFVKKTGNTLRAEVFVPTLYGGRGAYVAVTASPLLDTGGRRYGAIESVRDITGRKKAEEEIRRMNEELEDRVRRRTAELERAVQAERDTREAMKTAQDQLIQSEKMASLGQLVAGVAHEINNPLAFVINNFVVLQRDLGAVTDALNLYKEGSPTLAEVRAELYKRIQDLCDRVDMDYTVRNLQDLLTRSRDGLRRIQQIVQDLRDFARIDEGRPYEADLNAGIESTVNITRGQAKKKRVQILLDLKPIPAVECFPAKINQVVMNLVTNAIDACSDDGVIRVRTSASEQAVQIEVEDNGRGIEPAIANRIFDPFFTTKPMGEGLGLGLSISYSIVHDHGGTIEVVSKPGEGAKFIVSLPLHGKSRRPPQAEMEG